MYRYRNALLGAGLVLVTVAVYAQVVHFDFVGIDDPDYVTENRHVLGGLTGTNIAWAFTSLEKANWHPLTWLSLMLDAELGGKDPFAFHLTNVVLHVANTLLLFGVLLKMTGRPGPSATVAAWFAVHPLHVESVAWVTERKDTLSTLLGFASLAAYARYATRHSWGSYGLALLGFGLSLMAKPMLVTLPFILLLLEFWPLGRWNPASATRVGWWRSIPLWDKAPFLALAAASGWITLHAQAKGASVGSFEHFPLGVRIANALVSYVHYAAKMLWPTGLAVQYPYEFDVLSPLNVSLCALLLVSVTAASVWMARSRPYLLVGWLWYLVTLVPVIGLVQVGAQPMADRYTYVPLVGLFLAIVWGAADLLPFERGTQRIRSGVLAAAAIVTTILLAGTAHVQASHWRDTGELFTHALAVSPRNAMARNGLGLDCYERGELDSSVAHYREAIRISPRFVDAHINLAAALVRMGQPAGAASEYALALGLRPGDAETHANLGLVLTQMGRLAEAAGHFAEALRLAPGEPLAHKGLGYLLAQQGRNEEAAAHLRAGLEGNPEDAATRVNLATVEARLGRLGEAAAQLDLALRIEPNNVAARINLGILLVQQGRPREAIAQFSEVLRRNPGDEIARANLERARALAGAPEGVRP